MKGYKDIQKKMELNDHQARLRFGFLDATSWKSFRDAKINTNVKKMLQVFAECSDDAFSFLKRFADEVGVDISHKRMKRSSKKKGQ